MDKKSNLLEQGQTLNGTYRIIQEIGAGGGGIVYKAYHERLKTEVVVKKIKENVKDHINSRAEVDILKNIKHTYLPRVYDFLEIDGEIYTVMDYVPGINLSQAVALHGRYSQKEVIKWAIQICDALSYLHKQNPPIIHSDIKPANIMLTPDGDICLIDFNISMVFDKSFSSSLGISGGYSAPEQFESLGKYFSFTKQTERISQLKDEESTALLDESTAVLDENADEDEATAILTEYTQNSKENHTKTAIDNVLGTGITERSDIYSLGATLYHLLTGNKPSYDYEKIVPISKCGLKISKSLAYVVEKAMSLEPELRYQNGSEMLYDLMNLNKLDDRYKQFEKKKSRKKIVSAAACIVSIAMIAGGLYMVHTEKNDDYYSAVQASRDAIDKYDFITADNYITEAMSIYENKPEAHLEKMLLLYRTADYEGCIDYGKQMINSSKLVINDGNASKMGDIWFVMANAYFELEQYDNSIVCFNSAIELFNENAEYYRDLAIAYARQGVVDEAKTILDKAIEHKLGEDSIYMVQGEIAYAEGRYGEASDYFNKTIMMATDESLKSRATRLSAKALQKRGNIDGAIAVLEEYRMASENVQIDIYEMLGDLYASKAANGGGTTYYRKALELFETVKNSGFTTYQVNENIAILLQQVNDLPGAEKQLLEMKENYSDDYRVYKRLAYLEADKQQRKSNDTRDYSSMKKYYDQANELYERNNHSSDNDMEMQMLDRLMSEVISKGWL